MKVAEEDTCSDAMFEGDRSGFKTDPWQVQVVDAWENK